MGFSGFRKPSNVCKTYAPCRKRSLWCNFPALPVVQPRFAPSRRGSRDDKTLRGWRPNAWLAVARGLPSGGSSAADRRGAKASLPRGSVRQVLAAPMVAVPAFGDLRGAAGRDGGAGSGQKGIQGALAAIWVRFCHRVLNLPGKRPEQSKNKARVATRPAVPQSIACPLPASQRRAKFSRPNQSCLF